jgi:Fungal Zn(2)-Cys(6) binuclear cluster domain
LKCPLFQCSELRREQYSSCILCRSRKIRCNRGTPCSNCLKSRNGTCVYGNSPSHPPQQQLHLDQEPGASQYPTPSSNISRGSIAPSHPSSTLVTSSTNALTRANQPLSRDVDFLESRVRQLEEQEKANQRYSRPHVPTSDTNTETTTSRLEETFTLYKTRMLGRSHWMNGVTLVSCWGILLTLEDN